MLNCCDTSFEDNKFVTGGEVVQVWDFERNYPIHSFSWNSDTLTNSKVLFL